MKKTLIFVVLAIGIVFLAAKGLRAEQAAPRQAAVSLHEIMINNFFKAIGPVSGSGEKNKIKYTWTAEDARIDVEPGTAHFEAKVRLVAGTFKTVETARGQVKIDYVHETNRIRVRVEQAVVNLSIRVLGKHIPIGSVDIAQYYRPEFEFAGPQPVQKEIEISLPDGAKKKFQLSTKNDTLVLEKDIITVYSDVVFTPKP